MTEDATIMRVFNILPPAACYLLSVVAVASTYYVYESAFAKQRTLHRVLAAEPPQPIAVDQFDGPTEFGEVAVIARFRDDWTHSLTAGQAGDEERIISYLVAADTLGSQAYAALSVPSHKMDRFVAWLEGAQSGSSELGRLYTVSGRISGTESEAVVTHLAQLGVEMSDTFVTIEPYLDGRTAALTPPPINYTGYVIGGLIALFLAVLGYMRSVEDRNNRKPRVTSTEVMSKLTPTAPGAADPALDLIAPRVTSKADPDSPLGRIQARAQSESLES
jgi:hypothetical protein